MSLEVKMPRRKLIPVYHLDDVPQFATEAEAVAFWDTHCITDEYDAEARARGLVPERPTDRLARQQAARDQSGR
jgi:hypothetical protein